MGARKDKAKAMSPAVALNLRAIIQSAIDNTDIADPRQLADHLIDDVLTAGQYPDALRLTLPHYVRETMRQDRAEAIDGLSDETPASTPTRGSSGGSQTQTRSGKQNGSGRWSGTTDETGLLRTRIHNGTAWVILGDASREDLEAVVAEYERRAAQNSFEAGRYNRVAKLFDKHAANVVRDLPFDKVREAMA